MQKPVKSKEENIKRIYSQRHKLSALGVLNIGLFGSFARGEGSVSSDIDILIEFEFKKHTFDNFMEVAFLLEDILGRKVDLVTPQGLTPSINEHIEKELVYVSIPA